MFIYLSKILPQLLLPPGLGLELLTASLLLLRRPGRTARVTGALALVCLLVPATPICSDAILLSLEDRYPVMASMVAPSADAIVILGGGTSGRGPHQPEVELGSSGGRLLYGFRLFRAHKAPLLVLSGGSLLPGETEAEQMRAILSEWGVPDEAMVLERQSQNTHENAVQVVRLAQKRGFRRLLLVTSAFHMPRAMALFAHEGPGLQILPAPTGRYVTERRPYLLSGVLPDAGALAKSTLALRERIGILVYGLKGWL